MCERCRKVRREAIAGRVAARRELGMCIHCGEARDQEGRECCAECLAKMAAGKSRRRATVQGVFFNIDSVAGIQKSYSVDARGEARKERDGLGLCTTCGGDREGEFKTCSGCREKDRLRRKKK